MRFDSDASQARPVYAGRHRKAPPYIRAARHVSHVNLLSLRTTRRRAP
jgi:hypothetical protein